MYANVVFYIIVVHHMSNRGWGDRDKRTSKAPEVL